MSDSIVNFTFKWPAGPSDVVITGDFDEWKGSLPLVKQADNSFELSVPTNFKNGEEKFLFKFIVDGEWTTSNEYPLETDAKGISNNYIGLNDVEAAKTDGSVNIPEAGGLAAKTQRRAGPPSTKNRKKNNKKKNKKKKAKKTKKTSNANGEEAEEDDEEDEEETGTTTTVTEPTSREATPAQDAVHVLPVEQQQSTSPFMAVAGGLGPVIVSNPNEVKEFSEIRHTDPKEFNEKKNAEIKAKKQELEKAQENEESAKVQKEEEAVPVTKEEKQTEEKEVVPKTTLDPKANQPVPSQEESKMEDPAVEPVTKEPATSATEGIKEETATEPAQQNIAKSEIDAPAQKVDDSPEPVAKRVEEPLEETEATITNLEEPVADTGDTTKPVETPLEPTKVTEPAKKAEETADKKTVKRTPTQKKTSKKASQSTEDESKKKKGFFSKLKKLFQ
ncbi:hypothetical protein KAFR_0F00430 [Kazachstania africana CBS 2517]|uniref:AMP-activated protein kinase glycogen-binding domain-containing protein n=1 Tax=Kazachstania africana (strain ATCC 22294 / BCRC 22015 / CBS 2517 / CECT 1963 / NBRC 1671 / NRRL Y-8276) TaxID=1071382 RepID=H2AW90_KAZAF|nr:hypothetical protein KAFR_0F00430 [Kazachstania africana CBS 2517]CCF58640.1 hypothetical protein KAFR_0F00430 [Kazachstania africana CBS 2517]